MTTNKSKSIQQSKQHSKRLWKVILLLIVLITFTMNAYSLSDLERVFGPCGTIVQYKYSDTSLLYIGFEARTHIVKYVDPSNIFNITCRVFITKGFITQITLDEVIFGSKALYEKIVLPKLKEIFSFSDFGNREAIETSLTVTKEPIGGSKDAKTLYGELVWYIPITNLKSIKDENGKVQMECTLFRGESFNNVKNKIVRPERPYVVPAGFVNFKPETFEKQPLNFCNIYLPSNFEKEKDVLYLENGSQVLCTFNDFIVALEDPDDTLFYAYYDYMLNMKLPILPDSISYKVVGGYNTFSFSCISQINQEIKCLLQVIPITDGKRFIVIVYAGKADFIRKYNDMIEKIIKSVELS